VRDDNVQTVRRAALKDDDETLVESTRLDSAECGAGQEAWDRRCADDGEGAVAKEDATGDGHKKMLLALGY
jgi:hypothetical protein